MTQFKLLEEDKENINKILTESCFEKFDEEIREFTGKVLTEDGYECIERFLDRKIKLAQKIAFDAGYTEGIKSVEV